MEKQGDLNGLESSSALESHFRPPCSVFTGQMFSCAKEKKEEADAIILYITHVLYVNSW